MFISLFKKYDLSISPPCDWLQLSCNVAIANIHITVVCWILCHCCFAYYHSFLWFEQKCVLTQHKNKNGKKYWRCLLPCSGVAGRLLDLAGATQCTGYGFYFTSDRKTPDLSVDRTCVSWCMRWRLQPYPVWCISNMLKVPSNFGVLSVLYDIEVSL